MMMPEKRKAEEDNSATVRKKQRVRYDHDFSLLSDELVLKVLTYLPISDLAVCQRLSHRLQRLAGDSEVWKEKYYARWVKPRALRIPGLKAAIGSSVAFHYSSKLAKWLDDGHLVQQGRKTNWKRQYRLRDNWWRGHCKVRELEVGDPPAPPVLVKIHQGITFTADTKNGLRAWTTKTTPSLKATLPFRRKWQNSAIGDRPTSLGVDSGLSKDAEVCVGFDDGSFSICRLDKDRFSLRYLHARSSNGAISAIATFRPYLLTMSDTRILSLYRFPSDFDSSGNLRDPQLLASLRSSSVFAPISLSIRPTSGGLTASIAYAFSQLSSGWSVGLQELRMTCDGEALYSRLTFSTEDNSTSYHSIKNQDSTMRARSATSQRFVLHAQAMARPTALSYSHPYLLASLPDNTLMTYLVTSDADKLKIAPGRRLWGHTSSVSGVQVGERGKAVSVSARGGEIRVWELEDLLSSSLQRRTSVCIKPDTQDLAAISEAIKRRGDGLGLASREVEAEGATRRSWVGFDDEQVVVLGEHMRRQILSCYDFS